MYILKNALISITRSKGRNILVFIIALVIAVSACISLSIRQAAETAKSSTLSSMTITAQISYDRTSAMADMHSQMTAPTDGETSGASDSMGKGGFDRSNFDFSALIGETLTYDDYIKYTAAQSSGDSYYYTETTSLNSGSDDLVPYGTTTGTDSTETTDEASTSEEAPSDMPDGMRDMGGKMGSFVFEAKGDFSITGYSSYDAMMSLFGTDGTCTITDGEMFDVTSDAKEVIISAELALYNDIAVGDTITLANPNYEDETYEFKVVGIYTNAASSEGNSSFSFSDPANNIYMSSAAVEAITAESEAAGNTDTNEDGEEESAVLTSEMTFTYVFASADNYYTFADKVYDIGLSEDYTVSSQDLSAFESSISPLETLSSMAGIFFLVVLALGGVILVVLNIFNLRERKYEIGVLTAIGMKKSKVALQFISELFIVTFVAIIIGAGTGAAASVPVTNALLQQQIESSTSTTDTLNNNFGMKGGMNNDENAGMENEKMNNDFNFNNKQSIDYVDSVSGATNLTVILEMILVGIILTILSGLAAMITIMRYEPLKILSNRT